MSERYMKDLRSKFNGIYRDTTDGGKTWEYFALSRNNVSIKISSEKYEQLKGDMPEKTLPASPVGTELVFGFSVEF